MNFYNIQNDGIPSPPFEAQSQSFGSTNTSLHASNSTITHDDELVQVPSQNIIGSSPDVSLDKFFDRKVKIFEAPWNVGGGFNFDFYPWAELIRNDAFSRKIDNYALLKGKLMLTFYVNGTPQHSGMLLSSYAYMNATNESTVPTSLALSTYSQRPHIYMNASTGKGGCLCVPFLFPTPFTTNKLTFIPDRALLGRCRINSFADLRQINGGTDTVTVSVFAQIIDIVLAAPTPDLFQAQSDEYSDDGPISAPASAIANVAQVLEAVPMIQPFALATKLAASTVSSIAKLFGYSKPIAIHPITRVRNHPVSSLALVDNHDTSQKLTVTSKAELSIDPRLSEIEPCDTLSFSYFASRESYLGSIDWNPSAAAGQYIATIQVNPMAENRVIAGPATSVVPTSLSFITRPMSYWSGTIKIRLQVIASQFHRGRFSVMYFPNITDITSPIPAFNTSYNMIIDLAEGRDFSFDVKWQQNFAYLPVNNEFPNSAYIELGRKNPFLGSNGVLVLQVVNKLTVPDATTPATFLVSISAGDDFELANPKGTTLNVSPFEAQSLLEAQSATEVVPDDENSPENTHSTDLTTSINNDISDKTLNYFGETIVSARQLIKRYNFIRRVFVENNQSGVISTHIIPLYAMPPEPGYDPNGWDLTGGGLNYTYAGMSYLGYYKRAFAGWKGAIRWKVLPISGIKQISVHRRVGGQPDNDFRPAISTTLSPSAGASLVASEGIFGFDGTGAGVALTQNRTMDALEFEVPYTTNFRFSKVHRSYSLSQQNGEEDIYPGGNPVQLRIITEPSAPVVAFELYAAAGEDFQLIGNVGAPVMHIYPTPSA